MSESSERENELKRFLVTAKDLIKRLEHSLDTWEYCAGAPYAEEELHCEAQAFVGLLEGDYDHML